MGLRHFRVPKAVLLAMAGAVLLTASVALSEEAWTAPGSAASQKNPIPADAKSLALGKKVYLANCLACHGPEGKGDGPAAASLEKKPGDLSSEKVQGQSDGSMFWKITEGRKPMPTYRKTLKPEQRWNVINYVRTLAGKK